MLFRSSSAVTRLADNLTLVIGSETSLTQGTVVTHALAPWGKNPVTGQFYWTFVKNSVGFNDSVRFNQAANAQLERHGILVGGVGVTLDTGSFTSRAEFKTAMAWQASEQQGYSSNGSSITGISLTLPAIDRFCVGCAAVGANNATASSPIKSIHYYPVRKDNTFLQAAIVL